MPPKGARSKSPTGRTPQKTNSRSGSPHGSSSSFGGHHIDKAVVDLLMKVFWFSFVQAMILIGQIKKSFDPVDFLSAWKVEERYRRVEFLVDCSECSSKKKKQMMSMSSRSFSLLSLNFPVRVSYHIQVFNSITNQYDVYIYGLLSTL